MADKIQLEAIVDYIVKAGKVTNVSQTQREFDNLTAALARQLKVKPLGVNIDVDPDLKISPQKAAAIKKQAEQLNSQLLRAFFSGDANDLELRKAFTDRFGLLQTAQVKALKGFLDNVLSAYNTPATREFSKKHAEVVDKLLGGTSILDLSKYERRLAVEAAAIQKAQGRVLRKVVQAFQSVIPENGATETSPYARIQTLLLPQLEASIKESDKAVRRLDKLTDFDRAQEVRRQQNRRLADQEAADRRRQANDRVRHEQRTRQQEKREQERARKEARQLASQDAADRRRQATQRVKDLQQQRAMSFLTGAANAELERIGKNVQQAGSDFDFGLIRRALNSRIREQLRNAERATSEESARAAFTNVKELEALRRRFVERQREVEGTTLGRSLAKRRQLAVESALYSRSILRSGSLESLDETQRQAALSALSRSVTAARSYREAAAGSDAAAKAERLYISLLEKELRLKRRLKDLDAQRRRDEDALARRSSLRRSALDSALYSRSILRSGSLEDLSGAQVQAALSALGRSVTTARAYRESAAGTDEASKAERLYLRLLAQELRLKKQIRDLDIKRREAERAPLPANRIGELRALVAQRRRGLAAIEAAGGLGSVIHVPRESYRDVQAYLRSEQERIAQRIDRGSSRRGGISPGEVEQLRRRYAELTLAINQLNTEMRANTGIMHQAGLTLRAFLRYAVGYAALYKVIDGIRALGSATIDLEDSLKQIQAITGTTNAQLDGLAGVIKETAKSTRFGLGDISSAVKLVAQAGVDLKDIPATVQAVANLATSAGTALETAADVITTVKFVWADLDATTIADQVKQAANASKLAVDDLQTILSLGSSAAKQAGLSLDQFLGVAATLRNAGVRPSTIATGSGQLFTELFSPDKKTIEFLKKQYKKIGEDLSDELIFNRFAGFRFATNPVLAALSELKRLGVDAADTQAQLNRVFDIRAFRALIPLLQNLEKLPQLTAQITSGPTSFEAAQIAMDSFKASAENLGNALEALFDTLTADMLPGLTKHIKSLTEVIERFEEAISKVDSAEMRAKVATVASSALTGGVLGLAGGRGVLGRTLGAGVGTLAGGSAGAYLEFSDSGQATKDSLGEVGSAAAGVGIVALLQKLPGLFKRGVSTVVSDAAGSAGAATSVLDAIKKPFTTLKGSLLGLLRSTTFLRLNLWVLGITALFEAIIWGTDKLTSDRTPAEQLRTLQRRFAEQDQKRSQRQAALDTFRLSEPGRPAVAGGQAEQFEKAQSAVRDVANLLSEATGAVITDEFAAFEAALKIAREGAAAGPVREKLKQELIKQFGGTKDQVDEAVLKQATDTALTLSGAVDAIGQSFGDAIRSLVIQASQQGLESLNDHQRKALQHVFTETPDVYNRLLNSLPVQKDRLLKAYQTFLEQMQGGIKATHLTMEELADRLKSFADIVVKSGDLSALLALQGEMSQAIQTMGSSAIDLVSRTIRVIETIGSLTQEQIANLKQVQAQAVSAYIETKRSKASSFSKELQGFTDQVASDPKFRQFVESAPGGKDLLKQAGRQAEKLQIGLQSRGPGSGPAALAKSYEDLDKLIDPRTAETVRRLQDTYAQQQAQVPEKEKKGRGAGQVPYGPSAEALAREAEIQRLNLEIERLRDTNFSVLGKPGPENPLVQRLALEIRNAEEAFADKIRQAPSAAHKAAYGQQLKSKIQELQFNTQKQIDDFARSATRKQAQQQEKVLEQQIKDVEASIKVAEDTGDTDALTDLLAKQEDLYAQLRKVRETVLSTSVKDADIAAIRSDIDNQIGPRQIKRKGLESRLEAEQAAIAQSEKTVKYTQSLPADLNPELEGRRSVRGERAPISDRIAQLRVVLEQQRELLQTAQKQLSAQARLVEEARVAFGEKSPEYQKQVQGLRDIATKANEAAIGLGEVHEQLNKLAPTLENELRSVSLDNLANGIQELDSSLANLGGNIQGTLVGAINDLAGLVAEFVVNGFEAADALGEMESALQRVADAEARYYELQQSRIGLLEAIDKSAIAKENDPYVRTQIIDAATSGQRGLERLALEDVKAAKEEQRRVEEENSLFGQMKAIIQQAAQAISTSIIQALLLEKVKEAFGGRGATPANPLWVKSADPVGQLKGPSDILGGSSGILGGVSDMAAKGLGLLPGLGDFAKGGSGLGNFFSNMLMSFGFANGGYVSGPGTSTSDSILARVSNGEYVLNAKATRAIGKDTLDKVNRMGTLRFANGGYVAPASTPKIDQVKPAGSVAPISSDAYNPSTQGSSSIRIVNTIDPNLVHDYLASSAGERVIINHIQRNAGKIKQMVK